MASPEARLMTRLQALTAVTDLVSIRIYEHKPPQRNTTRPFVVYRIIDDVPTNFESGTTKTWTKRIQVDCVGSTGTSAHAVADAVRGDCDQDAPTGVAGWNDSSSGVWMPEGETVTTDVLIPGSDEYQAYIVSQDYTVDYERP